MKYIKTRLLFENKKNNYNKISDVVSYFGDQEAIDEFTSAYDDIVKSMNNNFSLLDIMTDIYIAVSNPSSAVSYTETSDFIISYINKVNSYKNVLRNNGYDILKKVKLEKKKYISEHGELYSDFYFELFELLTDDLEKMVLESEARKFAMKFISNKYKKLIDDDTIKIFNTLRDYMKKYDYSETDMYNEVSSLKFAAYKTPEEFNSALNQLIFKFNSLDKIISADPGIVIEYQDENVYVLDIVSYNSIKKIGPSSWCIQRSEYMFDSYKNYGINKQYVVIQKNLQLSDPLYMIGLTVELDGEISAIHDQYDDELVQSEINDYNWIKYIVPYTIDHFKENIKDLKTLVLYNTATCIITNKFPAQKEINKYTSYLTDIDQLSDIDLINNFNLNSEIKYFKKENIILRDNKIYMGIYGDEGDVLDTLGYESEEIVGEIIHEIIDKYKDDISDDDIDHIVDYNYDKITKYIVAESGSGVIKHDNKVFLDVSNLYTDLLCSNILLLDKTEIDMHIITERLFYMVGYSNILPKVKKLVDGIELHLPEKS